MVVQNPLDRVPGDVVAEIRERATDARVPPRWMLDRQPLEDSHKFPSGALTRFTAVPVTVRASLPVVFVQSASEDALAPVRLEFPILFMTATLCGLGGVRAVIAEHLLLKQQLLVLHRPRQRPPHLTASDRRLFGFGSLFLSPGRIRKIAI